MDKEQILREIRNLTEEDQLEILNTLKKQTFSERLSNLKKGVSLGLTMDEITKEVKAVRASKK